MKNKPRFFNLMPGMKITPPENFLNEDKTEATIYLYDEISYWWNGAEWFANTLRDLADVTTVHLRINTPGGDIFEARAMQVLMAEHPAEFVAHIDGVAASAGSFLIRGANKRVISDGGFIMIHQGSCFYRGNSQGFHSMAVALEKIDNSLIQHFVKVTGKSEEEVKAWFEAGTEKWIDSAEALDFGLVDEIVEAAPIENKFDLTAAYKSVPEALKVVPANKDEDTINAAARERELALAEILI